MVQELKDIRIEYESEEPSKIFAVGSGDCLYVPKILDRSFLFDKNYVYPCVVEQEGILKLAFFLSRPNEYFDKGYKIYRLIRPQSTATYIPIPKHLKPFLIDGKNKKPLVHYSIGCNSNGGWFILIEKYKNNFQKK